jgi:5'(3')-deoxyribonucleotidase
MIPFGQLRESIKEEEQAPLPQIYCDMDMVLVNFIDGANKALEDAGYDAKFTDKGQHNHKDKKWELLSQVPKFWANLEPMPDGLSLWKFISKYNPYILSTPSKRMPTSKPEKKEWLKKNLGMKNIKGVYLVPREDKQKWAVTNGTPNVLIDDYIKNIKEWEAAGGIGVHHTSTASTIAKLKKLGY